MNYLTPTYFFDFNTPIVQKMIAEYKQTSESHKQIAVSIYLKVRDEWQYDPYTISLSKAALKASTIAAKTSGNCVEKSILLIACFRALGMPSRLHLGKVRNHIAAERLIEKFGSNELTPHGMVNVYLNDQWLKLSPAFNKSLCKKFHVPPLDFDAETNSFLQQYTNKGDLFMEYTDDYGHFEDVPIEFMRGNLKAHYPHIFNTNNTSIEFKL